MRQPQSATNASTSKSGPDARSNADNSPPRDDGPTFRGWEGERPMVDSREIEARPCVAVTRLSPHPAAKILDRGEPVAALIALAPQFLQLRVFAENAIDGGVRPPEQFGRRGERMSGDPLVHLLGLRI